MILGNKGNRSVVIVELINSEIDTYPKRLQPGMGCRAAFAYYALRFVVSVLAKILCDKVNTVSTSADRKRGERDWQSFRIALVQQDPKFQCESLQAAWITVHDDGRFGFTKDRPRNTSTCPKCGWRGVLTGGQEPTLESYQQRLEREVASANVRFPLAQ